MHFILIIDTKCVQLHNNYYCLHNIFAALKTTQIIMLAFDIHWLKLIILHNQYLYIYSIEEGGK